MPINMEAPMASTSILSFSAQGAGTELLIHFGLFVFVTAQYDVRQQGIKDKYKSCVPQIQISFCTEILVEKVCQFSSSSGELKEGRTYMMPSTFAKRKKNSEKKEPTSSSTSRMKLR